MLDERDDEVDVDVMGEGVDQDEDVIRAAEGVEDVMIKEVAAETSTGSLLTSGEAIEAKGALAKVCTSILFPPASLSDH